VAENARRSSAANGTANEPDLTVDELARRAGTTTRNVRAFQTLGLLPHPRLRGRTGLYDREHLDRLEAVLRLQRTGFSLAALGILFDASDRGVTLEQVLGLTSRPGSRRPGLRPGSGDNRANDHLRAFDDWPGRGPAAGLAVVPTTVLDLVAS